MIHLYIVARNGSIGIIQRSAFFHPSHSIVGEVLVDILEICNVTYVFLLWSRFSFLRCWRQFLVQVCGHIGIVVRPSTCVDASVLASGPLLETSLSGRLVCVCACGAVHFSDWVELFYLSGSVWRFWTRIWTRKCRRLNHMAAWLYVQIFQLYVSVVYGLSACFCGLSLDIARPMFERRASICV